MQEQAGRGCAAAGGHARGHARGKDGRDGPDGRDRRPGMGGFGGAPPGGMGGMGGAPPGYGQSSAQGGRKSYGSGADGGSVVDIDADVKDV